MEASTLALRSAARIPLSRKLLAALSDEKLVAQVRSGSESAFEVIFDRYHRAILAFCRHMLGSQHEAEDVVQGTFAAAYTDLLRSRSDIHLKPWLFTIARNRCLSALRARRESCAELDPQSLAAGLAEEVERRADLRALVADIAELPEQQRAALVLAELRALSHPEIAEVLGCEAGKVKSLVFQARSTLLDSRKAREIPCDTIRGELATLSRGSLRRSYLRKHLRECPGCSEFRDEIKRQRAMLGAVLPVAPSLALKQQTLSALGLGGGSAAGAGGIAASLGTQAVAVKIAVAVAVGGAGAGGVALERATETPAAPAASAAQTVVRALPAPTFVTHGRHRLAPTPPPGADPRPGSQQVGSLDTGGSAPPATPEPAPALPDQAVENHGVENQAVENQAVENQAVNEPVSPEHQNSPEPSAPRSEPPGQSTPVEPDVAITPAAPQVPGNSGSAPGHAPPETPGNSATAPGHGGELPGNANGGVNGAPPGHSASAPGHLDSLPGPPSTPPGKGGPPRGNGSPSA